MDYSYKQQVAFLMSDAFNNQVSYLMDRFETLFAQPPADLSSILRESPQAPCSEALGPSLLQAAEANPLSIDDSVKSLVAGLSTTQDIIHTDIIHNGTNKDGDPYFNTPFNDLVRCEIANFLLHALLGPHQSVISRKNTMFSYALLAGSAVRTKLLDTGLIEPFVDRGLQLPGAITTSYGAANRREVVAIGVCLVLLVAGGLLLDEWRVYDVNKLEAVVVALKSFKAKKVIQYPTGVDLLERTIAVAEGEFSAETPAADAWKLLFPDDAEDEEDAESDIPEGTLTSIYRSLAEFYLGVNML